MTVTSPWTGGDTGSWLEFGGARSQPWALPRVSRGTYVLRVSCADSAEVAALAGALGPLVVHGDALDSVQVAALAHSTALDHDDHVLIAHVRLAVRAVGPHTNVHSLSVLKAGQIAGGTRSAAASLPMPGPTADGAAPASAVARAGGDAPEHAVLALRLREMTGLPATRLAAALGVGREQFQRWVAGSPISATRHGQLRYLHWLAADAARRLGTEAHPWWRTPGPDGRSPEDLLQARLVEVLHARVADLADDAPVVDGVLVTLPLASPLLPEDVVADEDGDAEPWSPYDEAPPEA
ncbi:MAG: hypothetical protein M3524_05330 [Actinomycetota bacterium]|nr:hypothetical protein [Actinomycetota bacterium]